MSATAHPIYLPKSLEEEAMRLAGEDGVSLDHWVSLAVAQKIGSVETAAEFFGNALATSAPIACWRF